MFGQLTQDQFQLAGAHPLLKTAMTGLERWILLRQLAPLRTRAQNPQHAIQNRTRVMPRPSTIVGPPCRAQHRLYQFPLFVGQFPAAMHAREWSTPEHNQNATTKARTGL